MTKDWRRKAACIDLDPNLFFPEQVSGAHLIVRRAKSVCSSCAVRSECLTFALSFSDRSFPGIWGGTTEAERRRLKRTA